MELLCQILLELGNLRDVILTTLCNVQCACIGLNFVILTTLQKALSLCDICKFVNGLEFMDLHDQN